MIHLWEDLTLESGRPKWSYRPGSPAYKRRRISFAKLKRLLEKKDIDPEDYIRVQFQCKGKRIFHNQLSGKYAMDRYEAYIKQRDVEGIHAQQETYLKMFMKNGYTLEETLQFHIFYYYFRCMKLKNHPKEWLFKVKKEIDNIPELREFIKEREK